MKKLLIVLFLAATPLGSAYAALDLFAAPPVPEEFIPADFDGVAYGTVELLQPALPMPVELPEHADAALVRLDDGRRIVVTLRPLQEVAAGQRVRVLSGDANGPRIEPA
jgi:hypothetical protein